MIKLQDTARINFQGYKNLISGGQRSYNNRFMFLSAELNNRGNYSDLAEYQKLIGMLPLYKTKYPDICCLLYIQNNYRKMLMLNEALVYGCEELQNLQASVSIEYYSRVEAAMMKAHTLIASITKRISNGDVSEKDKNITTVVRATMENLSKLFDNKESAHKLFTSATLFKPSDADAALLINNYIKHTMEKFFKD